MKTYYKMIHKTLTRYVLLAVVGLLCPALAAARSALVAPYDLTAVPSHGLLATDAWGHLQQSGSYNFSQSFGTNNRISAVGYVYDAAGDLTQDGLGNTYTYRADGHQATSNGVTYSYGGLDNRAVKTSGSTCNEHFYSGGSPLATINNSVNWTNVFYTARIDTSL